MTDPVAPEITRVAVFGNCQAYGLSVALAAISPDIIADACGHPDLPEIMRIMKNYDVIALQNTLPRHFVEELSQISRVVVWPSVEFPAFHPDITYATSGGKWLQSAMGDYNSAIMLYGILKGFSPSQLAKLFCEEAFENLGYFDGYARAAANLLANARETDVPLDDMLPVWTRSGVFMHSVNHPKIHVIAGIARQITERLGISVSEHSFEVVNYLHDNLTSGPVWPVYSGIPGAPAGQHPLIFKKSHSGPIVSQKNVFLSLGQFINETLESYSNFDLSTLSCPRLADPAFEKLDRFAAISAKRNHPYFGLPDHQFWKKAVTAVDPDQFDPVVHPKFLISPATRVSTAGSCFAQHISRRLSASGFNHFIAEPAPPGLSQAEAEAQGFGLFSAKYGNIYTSRQLLQLIDRAYGRFDPVDSVWRRTDGRFVDAFRPNVTVDGFATPADVMNDTHAHLALVRKMFEELDLFVFTLGLTECWQRIDDGAVYPLAPGVAGGQLGAEHRFLNLSVGDVIDDMSAFFEKLWKVNGQAKVILTVSPVPLAATYTRRNVLVATSYSKAVLRAAVEELAEADDRVDYFPSYEIITGNLQRSRYFDDDLRSVNSSGVDHVMRVFMKNYTTQAAGRLQDTQEMQELRKVFCDEDRIADV